MHKLLTIAIPTYNRADKLRRLLKKLEDQINLDSLGSQIEILVSDNASTDNTPGVISEFSENNNFKLKYFRQLSNLGFDFNCKFLYEKTQTDYVWFFSDDDIPLPCALSIILERLWGNKPDALIFSFEQPPETKVKAFNFSNNYEIFTEPSIIIELISKYPKISTYVLRKIPLSAKELRVLEPFFENGFFFINLAFSVMHASRYPKLCVVSQRLAVCDEDYVKFTFDPKIFFEVYKIFYHPFVVKYSPGLAEREKDRSYCTGIQFIFAAKSGALITSKPELLDSGLKDAGIRMFVLLRNPKTLIQVFLIKMNLTEIYKKIRPLMGLFRVYASKLNNKNVLKRFIKGVIEGTPLSAVYRAVRDELRFSSKEFVKTPLGYKFAGNPAMQTGTFEPEEAVLIRHCLDSAEIFVDIGANAGYFTCLACSMKKRVIAVEPLPDNLRYLYANLHENGWIDGVEIYPVGLAEKPGSAALYGTSTGASLIPGWAGISTSFKRTIPLSTLDILLGHRFHGKKMVIKMDVEGAEYAVLQGAANILQAVPRPTWLVEITLSEHRQGQDNPYFLETFEQFWKNGYEVREVGGKGSREISRSEIEEYVYTGNKPDWAAGNYLFVDRRI